MAEEYKLPDLGENVEGGDVLAVLVKVGEMVSREQSLIELETDKAVLEVPASFSGKVEKLLIQAGDHIKVGQTILHYSRDGKGAKSAPPEKVAPAPEAEVPAAVETAEQEEEPTREVPQAVEAKPAAGERPGKIVEFGRPQPSADDAPVAAAPSVRRLAREIGVDIRQVSGSGPRGRISRDDVKAHAQRLLSAGPTAVPAAGSLPDFSRWGEVTRQRMSAVRRATSQHMARSWSQVPHVTQVDEADITDLEERRQRYAAQVEQEGGKLTLTAILLKVLAAAVRRHPQFGASIDPQQEEVVYKNYVHVGVAVDTPRGLLVPVVRDVDTKNIVRLARELRDLAERARQAKLAQEEMQGGCITVTNLGGIGGTSFTPIVNWPEVAILGVSRAAIRPVLREGQFVPRQILPLSLSYDHRLIDGADAARFLRWICQALEDPFLLTLEG